MWQFYFLSIIMNALAGYLLFFGEEGSPLDFTRALPIKPETFRFTLGILSAITGLLKLLSPIDVLIIGDLIPAIAGFLCGFSLILEYFRSRSAADVPEQPEKIEKVLFRNKKVIGAAALIVAVLHFFVPGVLLL
jgi:hypothetical protein